MARTHSYEDPGEPLDPLWQCRQDIDRVDRVLAALLCERTRLALHAGQMKLAAGDPIPAPARETAVLAHVSQLAGEPLEAERLVRIFRIIIHETREAETQALAHAVPPRQDALS